MDFLTELENMASTAQVCIAEEEEPSTPTIEKWQNLFSYTADEAVSKIKAQRADVNRLRVSDDHWELVRDQKSAEGYDREAYEHALSRKPTRSTPTTATAQHHTAQSQRMRYLFKLGGPVDTPEKVREVLGKEDTLLVRTGLNDNEDDPTTSQFCELRASEKDKVLDHLSKFQYTPTLVPLRVAAKDLSSRSIHPTLGLDSTLPQHRLSSAATTNIATPHQNEYPLWYFFYGTLIDTEKLYRLCGSVTGPLIPASVGRGAIKTWAGRFKALLDAPDGEEDSRVVGAAYLVMSEEHEYTLRVNETDNYEVVRCEIRFEGSGEVKRGCTFRFCGPAEGLS
ncbi:MAG: hypothetical protein M1831_000676 [Alyxoria varia]|nr:MAG: hypothetical protein M1831_000676 [Alyxoria varia]